MPTAVIVEIQMVLTTFWRETVVDAQSDFSHVVVAGYATTLN